MFPLPEGSLLGDGASRGRFPRRRLAVYPALSPPFSLAAPLCLALGITRGLRPPSLSAGRPGDWLPALTARWGSRPAPLPASPSPRPARPLRSGPSSRPSLQLPGPGCSAGGAEPQDRLQGLHSGSPAAPHDAHAGRAWLCLELVLGALVPRGGCCCPARCFHPRAFPRVQGPEYYTTEADTEASGRQGTPAT